MAASLGLWVVLACVCAVSAIHVKPSLATAPADTCQLPAGARRCTVHLADVAAFDLAVYEENDIVSSAICNTGRWETHNMGLYGPPGSAVDIGANVGYYTFSLARAGWNVTAFEPATSNLELLSASLCRNPELAPKITLHPCGLGPRNERCTLISDNSNVGDGIMNCKNESTASGYKTRGSFDLRRLDDVLAEQNLGQIDVMKIDVEGFECEVFAGGQSVLSKYRPRLIQSEVWAKMKECKPEDYLATFQQGGYVVAKDLTCDVPDASIGGKAIQDFYMCQKTKRVPSLLQLWQSKVRSKADIHTKRVVFLRRA